MTGLPLLFQLDNSIYTSEGQEAERRQFWACITGESNVVGYFFYSLAPAVADDNTLSPAAPDGSAAPGDGPPTSLSTVSEGYRFNQVDVEAGSYADPVAFHAISDDASVSLEYESVGRQEDINMITVAGDLEKWSGNSSEWNSLDCTRTDFVGDLPDVIDATVTVIQ